MARLDDLSPEHRDFVTAYPFERYAPPDGPVPGLAAPLASTRVALVTTGGLHLPGQPAFDRRARGGDPGFRILPDDLDPEELRCAHKSDAFDHAGVEQDPELAYPISALHALVRAGEVGASSPIHLSYMGSITAPRTLIRKTAPEGARQLAAAGAEAALLVPV